MAHYRVKLKFKSSDNEAFSATVYKPMEAATPKEAIDAVEAALISEASLEWTPDVYLASSEAVVYVP